MQQTENYNLQLYEPNDMANLLDGYNESMETLDDSLKGIVDDQNARFPINTSDIANGAVTTDKISTAAITGEKIASNAVDTVQIADNSVNLDKITNSAIDNIITQGSNNLITSDAVYDALNATNENIEKVNDDLIAQQLNGNYHSISIVTEPAIVNEGCNIYVADNYAYWFIAGLLRINAGAYNLIPIPGSNNRYGFKLTNTPLTPTPPSDIKTYNLIGFSQNLSTNAISVVNCIIGTDGNLYMNSFNTQQISYSQDSRYFFLQSKLTMTNLNITPIDTILED